MSCQRIAAAKHADVQVIALDSGAGGQEAESRVKISVEQIEQVQHSASLPPFEGRRKVFILDAVEFLSIGAANRLLKTLEEPEPSVLFVLVTANESLLPETVVSRCQRVELVRLGSAKIEAALTSRWAVEPEKARLLSRLADGCLGWAISAAEDEGLLRQRKEWLDALVELAAAGYEQRFAYAARLASGFGQDRRAVSERLGLWLGWWRDLLLVKSGCGDAITNVDRAGELATTAETYTLAQIRAFIESIRAAGEQLALNANPQLVLEVLMLSIPQQAGAASPA
jgi:DNA polymerase-3 subunit delta'